MARDLDGLKTELFNQFNAAVKNEASWEKAENVNAARMSMAALAQAIVAIEQEQRLAAAEAAKKRVATGTILNG